MTKFAREDDPWFPLLKACKTTARSGLAGKYIELLDCDGKILGTHKVLKLGHTINSICVREGKLFLTNGKLTVYDHRCAQDLSPESSKKEVAEYRALLVREYIQTHYTCAVRVGTVVLAIPFTNDQTQGGSKCQSIKASKRGSKKHQ